MNGIVLRRLYLSLIFAFVAIGPNMPAVGLSGLRLLVLIFLFFALVRSVNSGWRVNKIQKNYFYLAIAWIFFGALGCLWVDDIYAGIKELLDVFFGLMLALVVVDLGRRDRFVAESVSFGWAFAYSITLLVAFWELSTGQHLQNSYSLNLPDYALSRIYVMSTFGNPNNYGAFLVLSFPFLIFGYIQAPNKIAKFLMMVLLLTLPLVLIFTASRGAFIGVLVVALVFFGLKNGWRKIYYFVFAFLVSAVIFYLLFDLFEQFSDDLFIFEKFAVLQDVKEEGSLSERFAITVNGLYIALSSFGMGVGPNGFSTAVVRPEVPYQIVATNPHNFGVEILSQYGLIVFSLFIILLWKIFAFHALNIRSNFLSAKEKNLGITVLASLVGYLFASSLNSSYISQPQNWTYIGVIVLLTSCAQDRYLES